MVYNQSFIGFFAMLTMSLSLSAQSEVAYDPLQSPNTFRHKDNPLYWKNRIPAPGYWQQDIYYKINAVLDDETDMLVGTEWLTYWNNSPDTLRDLYFHLYQNAYQPDSYLDQRKKSEGDAFTYTHWEAQKKGTDVESLLLLEDSHTTSLSFDIDNTLLHVAVPYPIVPGDSVILQLSFKTYFDPSHTGRRMLYFKEGDYKVYKGVHWYPRLSVYDRRWGWDKNQHLDSEFYGDFGSFDVEITLPHHYVTEATGLLQNESDVLPPDLKAKIEIRLFKDKDPDENITVILPREKGTLKTWKYHAENVHDFAFITSPAFRRGEAEWKGIKAISLALESNASGWQNAADYAARCMAIFSEDIGTYPWNKIIVADADDAMEYPMITLDGEKDPEYRSTLSHEIGHMWFYGMVGNNETYRPFLDEGFTQFLTTWAEEKIDGKMVITRHKKNKFLAKYKEPRSWRYNEIYRDYFKLAGTAHDIDLTTHSDHFNGDDYWLIYNKTAAMLYALQYVLGDELFLKGMKFYFEKWKFCHPYEEDMQKAFMDGTGTDLQWFFDQWTDTQNATVDYRLKKTKPLGDGRHLLKIKRMGDMEMPLDLVITDRQGEDHKYYIPNRNFIKQEAGTPLHKWYGWNHINRIYTDTLSIPDGIRNIRIDTSMRMGDIRAIDNQRRNKIKLSFDHQLINPPPRDKYVLLWRPDLWYNHYDGLKTGFHLEGAYLNDKWPFSLSTWYNTGLLAYIKQDAGVAPDYYKKHDRWSFNFSAAFSCNEKTRILLGFRHLDGVDGWKVGMVHQLNKGWLLGAIFRSSIRREEWDRYYSIHPFENEVDFRNNNIEFSLDHRLENEKWFNAFAFKLFMPALLSESDFTGLSIENIYKPRNGHAPRLRLFGQLGYATHISAQQSLFLYGNSPYDMFASKYTRSTGIIPSVWGGFGTTTNHFHDGGGLNLRAYSGYAILDRVGGVIKPFYRSTGGWAANTEWDIDDFINWKPAKISPYFHLDIYLLADLGMLSLINSDKKIKLGSLQADAGWGAAFTIKKFGFLEKPAPLTIRIDMPVWMKNAPAHQSTLELNRWIIGINRAF